MTVPNLALNSSHRIPQLGFGVSNFQVAPVRRLVRESDVVPAANQIEVAISVLSRDEEGRTGPNPDVFAWITR